MTPACGYGNAAKTLGGNAGPNAVRSINKVGGGTASYSYDNNGNMLSGDGRTISYNAFNKPTVISKGGITSQFFYGSDQMRYKQVKTGLPNGTETTVYVGKAYEEIRYNGSVQKKLYLGDVIITEQSGGSNAGNRIAFVHRDRLGSVVTLTDQGGNVIENRSYDPFGKPRLGNFANASQPKLFMVAYESGYLSTPSQELLSTRRGFTDHEHLDDAELIHMNGRAYDYKLGRFLSVDPFIQEPGNSQSMNPYSYIMNNPLAGVDPSGYLRVCDTFIVCSQEQVRDENFNKTITAGNGETNNGNTANRQSSTPNVNSSRSPEEIGSQSSLNGDGVEIDGEYWDVTYSGDGKEATIGLHKSGKAVTGGTLKIALDKHEVGIEWDVLEAIDYMEEAGSTVFRDLAATGEDTKILPTIPGDPVLSDAAAVPYLIRDKANGGLKWKNGGKGEIYINMRSGLKLPSGEVQSPAVTLAHEAQHLVNAFRDPNTYARYKQSLIIYGPNGNSMDYEEARVIFNIEHVDSAKKGEPLRDWHSQGVPYQTQCATCRY